MKGISLYDLCIGHAAGTGVGSDTFLKVCCLLCHNRCIRMSLCSNIIRYISLTAFTGISREALFRTSGSCYNCIITVSQLFYCFCVCITTSTGEGSDTCFKVCSLFCNNRCIAVSCCIYIIRNITVTAFTGVGCETVFCASGGCYNCNIAVSQLFNYLCVSITASTGEGSDTLFKMCCFFRYNRSVRMSVCNNIIRNITITAFTSVGCEAVFCASGCCYSFIVSMLRKLFYCLCITVATMTCEGFYTLCEMCCRCGDF